MQTDEAGSVKVDRLDSFGADVSLSVGIDLDHLQLLLTLLEVINDFDVVVMLVVFFELLQHFVEDGVAHLVPSFFCFLEHILVFFLQLLVLGPPPVEVYFLFIAEVGSRLFFLVLFLDGGDCRGLFFELIVVFSLPEDLCERVRT